MRAVWLGGAIFGSIVVLACVLLAPSCGSGGGSAPGSVSELAGGWLGPTGGATAGSNLTGTMGAGMDADLSGAFAGTGAFAGKSGTIVAVAPKVFRFVRQDLTTGFMILSDRGDHLAYVDSNNQFGIWQRAGGMNPPGAATTGDTFTTSWAGTQMSFDIAFDHAGSGPATFAVDGAGVVALTASMSMGVTNVSPLALVDGATGEFAGDLTDGMDTGYYTLLLSPDRTAAALFLCGTGGIFPQDCVVGILDRTP